MRTARLQVKKQRDGYVSVHHRGRLIGSFTVQRDGGIAAVVVPHRLAGVFRQAKDGRYFADY